MEYDVIICGAGPVGLFLACELAMRECSVLILEKAQTPYSPLKRFPFGLRGLSAPSIEALDRRGMLDKLEISKRLKNPHQDAGQGANRQIGHFAGIALTEGNIDTVRWTTRIESSTPNSLISEIEELETVFARRAESLGVSIERGIAVTNFQQSENAVNIQAGDRKFESKWLVGCDGARSVVRKIAEFEFAGTEPEFTGYSIGVDLKKPEQLKPGRNVTATGMYMQSQPGYLVLQEFDKGAFHSSGAPITVDHVQDVLRRVSNSDAEIAKLHFATSWTDRARQATTYRKERVLLAGDSAHIHSPLGGQGLNLGLGDAMNLGWKLAATIHGHAAKDLLDSYESERIPVGEKVLDWSRAQVAIMKTDPAARALYAIVRDVMNTRDGATYCAGRIWGIHTRYDLGNSHPLVGRSVPNFEFEDGRKVGALMRDGQALLIDFKKQAALKKYESQIKYVSGSACNELGLSAVLVRPDGIIAWAADLEWNEEDLKTALARWLN